DAEQRGALRGPVARRARAVLLAAEHDERDARLRVVLRRVVDRGLLAREEVARESALDARYELVAQPDVGEGATDHDLVVAAARAVGVEVASVDPALREVLARGAVGLDRAGRGDVAGRGAVAELCGQPPPRDVRRRHGLQAP